MSPFSPSPARKRSVRYFLPLIAMTMIAASPAAAATPAGAGDARETLQLRLGALADDPRVAGQPVADPWFLARFYERREFTPAWEDSAKLGALLGAIEGSWGHGLDPGDYHLDALQRLAEASGILAGRSPAIELELLATDALVRFAFHLRFGKVNPEQFHPTWNFNRSLDGTSPVAAIDELLAAPDLGAALEALAPDSGHYRALRRHLEQHREIARQGGWPPVPAGETLRPGMHSPRVAALRARLVASGDLAEPAGEPDPELFDPELFDDAVDVAVRRFQGRHGLAEDGLVGRQTLAALNVPVQARIDQLRVNLERVRWVFRDLEPRFLLVNIARFRVVLVEDRQITWSTRAVVGRPYRQTPVFRARMTYLELNPTWTVPPTILRDDLLPDLRRDPAELERRNMVVIDHQGRRMDAAAIDWRTVTARTFPYMIRQEPGPNNSLGRVKLMYPNPYHVYMHDTPARALFARPERTFSSGCIRLENPFELVRILLAGTEWDDAAIQRVLDSGRTRVINLPQPIPVLTLYGTAVPEDGLIHFAADVYQRDGRVLTALDAPFEFSPPAGYRETVSAN